MELQATYITLLSCAVYIQKPWKGLHVILKHLEFVCQAKEAVLLVVVGPASPNTTNSTAITKLRR
jgi:hypothetical protein